MMPRPPVPLKKNTLGLLPLASSLYPRGDEDIISGGSSALRYFAIGGEVGHGDVIIVKTDGTYDFGTRIKSSAEIITVGDRAWVDGSEFETVESSLSDGAAMNSSGGADSNVFRLCEGFAARGEKAGRGDWAWESRTESQTIGSPFGVAASATPDLRTTGKIAVSFSMRHMGSLNSMRLAYYTASTNPQNLIGSDTSTFEYGETITGTKSGGGAFTGTLIAVNTSNSSVMFIPNGSYNSTDNNGATFTGDISGASVTLGAAGYTIPLANKPIRMSTNNSEFPDSSDEVGLDFITTSDAQFAHKLRGFPDVLEDERPQATINQSGNEWESWLYIIDYSGSEFVSKTYRNGELYEYTFPNASDLDLEKILHQLAVIQFAYDWGGSTNPTLIRARMKNFCLDYNVSGATIGDAAALEDCTQVGHCGVVQTQTNQLSLIRNYGDIETGSQCYLFVRGTSGEYVNSNSGLPIGEAP